MLYYIIYAGPSFLKTIVSFQIHPNWADCKYVGLGNGFLPYFSILREYLKIIHYRKILRYS